jgi:uncharacterized membrane protein YidH (DUF202 family)
MAPKRKELYLLIIVAVLAVATAYMAWEGAYELFADVYAKHYARIQIEPGEDWHDTRVSFYLNTPTVSSFFVLAGGLFGLYGAVRFYVAVFARNTKARKIRFMIYLGTGLATAFIATLVYMHNFFTTAFDGVG